MKQIRKYTVLFLGIILITLVACQNNQDGAMDGMENMDRDTTITTELNVPKESTQGLYKATISSNLDPIAINQMHSWTLHLETADGQAVDDAKITVRGGMPAHDHGMPTAPEVTQSLGEGNYLVEGLQFQMAGHWEVTFDITDGDQTDSVIFTLMLE